MSKIYGIHAEMEPGVLQGKEKDMINEAIAKPTLI